MSSPTIQTNLGQPSPTFIPTTLAELYSDINSRLISIFTQDYIPYIKSGSTPAVSDQDKIWLKLDGAGKPLGFFFYYNGNWRKVYLGASGDIKWYSGNPTVDFDASGLGIIGGNQDGWALANGNNGTVDLSNLFVATANMDNTGGQGQYNNGWQSLVDGVSVKKVGGVNTLQLDATNTYRPATSAVTVAKWRADGNTPDNTGGLIGQGTSMTLVPADPGNPTPPAITGTVPPFFSLALLIFVGY